MMEFYILDSGFNPIDLIENYQSALWTERYYFTGDFEFSFSYSEMDKLTNLVNGAFIKEKNSVHVGIVSKIIRKDGVVKVSGEFLEGFLKRRAGRKISGTSSQFKGNIQWIMAVFMWFYLGDIAPSSLGVPNAAKEELTNLDTGVGVGGYSIYPSAPVVTVDLDGTPNMYDLMVSFAEPHEVGWRLYPEVNDSGYVLKFRPYLGVDRSASQSSTSTVVLSADFDSLKNSEEIITSEEYFSNVCVDCSSLDPTIYGYASDFLVVQKTAPGTSNYTDFKRTTKFIVYDDLSPEIYNYWNSSSDNGMLKAKDVLTNRAESFISTQIIKKMLTGELVNTNIYQYNRDYLMGDVITIQASDGYSRDVRIVEYIQSEDATGYKAYPTVMAKT